MLVKTLPHSAISTCASRERAANNRSSESSVKPQYQTERLAIFDLADRAGHGEQQCAAGFQDSM
jgi:hypothetical protein